MSLATDLEDEMIVPGPPMGDMFHDQFRRCEDELNERGFVIERGSCAHDLARGVLLEELQSEDGPFPPDWPASIFPEDNEEGGGDDAELVVNWGDNLLVAADG